MDSKVLKRGRPKGAEQIVIGLPAKRKCFTKPVTFCKKDPLQKTKVTKNIWSAVNLKLYIMWFMLCVKVKVNLYIVQYPVFKINQSSYALLVDLFNRTPFYIIHKIQPVIVTRHVPHTKQYKHILVMQILCLWCCINV